jgi:hypothetical protein
VRKDMNAFKNVIRYRPREIRPEWSLGLPGQLLCHAVLCNKCKNGFIF